MRSCCALVALAGVLAAPNKPNIFLLLTDDQDVKMDSVSAEFMPQLAQLVAGTGTTFENAFAAVPVCCPSRSSLHTGRLQHNTGVVNNSASGQCAGSAWVAGPEKDSGAVHLSAAGYRTSFSGKYLNEYGLGPDEPGSYVPPGWDNWVGLHGNSAFYNYKLSVNGTTVAHNKVYPVDYLPLIIRNATLTYVASQLGIAPVYAVMSFPSCHQPADPEPQYSELYPGIQAPRHDNFNVLVPDTHWFESSGGVYGVLDPNALSYIDLLYRRRLQTLRTVDDAVMELVAFLRAAGQLDNSYIVYTADNGYHLGNAALSLDKRQAWDYDTHIPLIITGPGVAANASLSVPVSHIDLMPTFLDIAGATIPATMDGVSLLPLLRAANASASAAWPRDTVLVEYHGEYGSPGPASVCPNQDPALECVVQNNFSTAPFWPAGHTPWCSCQDTANNTYACIRIINSTSNLRYCEFDDAVGFVEYFDIAADYYEMKNEASTLPPTVAAELHDTLTSLRTCSGASCNVF